MDWKKLEELDALKVLGPGRKIRVFLGSLLLVGLIDYIEYLNGPEIHLSVMLLIPIYFVTWNIGYGASFIISAIGAVSTIMDPMLYPRAYPKLGIVLWNIVALFVFFIVFAYVVSRLKKELVRTHELAHTDNLTGLLNSRAFFDAAEHERIRAVRYGHPFTLCFLDLDNFKQVNDTYGHLTGDELLKIVAVTLKEGVRETDLVVRLGGDEFAILFPETGLEAVQSLVIQIHEVLNDGLEKRGWEVTPSMGIVTFYEAPGTVNEILHEADQLMYEAKKAGKNRIKTKVVGASKKKLKVVASK